MQTSRREFLTSTLMATLTAPKAFSESSYRIGITTNTRGGWENDVWLSFREAREIGYRNVESFIHYFKDFYDDKAEELKRKMDEIGVRFVSISNGAPMEMRFEDPASHEKIIDQHMRLIRFIKKLGCEHLKINMGPRRQAGTTGEDLKQMARALGEIGKRSADEGIKFAVHAHMWSQFENRREIDYVMEHTNARQVYFVLDTGHITMSGIDPVELTRALGHRIVEFHLKDTKPEHRGGAKTRLERPDVMKDPPFFPLGHGGIDFPAIKSRLDEIGWRGWLTVELDSSPYRPPKESSRISGEYLERTLGLKL
ncbi:MAG TPA: sugar phosphate isomerase/epimerase [Blastocatellia bacterium]|nr:sugar phosphate isomerase/epimerase [Blastocatellia bacterium]